MRFAGAASFLLVVLNHELRHWNALRPRGPLLFRSAGKGSKRGRFRTALRQRQADRHEPTCSANLPKLDHSRGLKHMERFVFALQAKIPSRATQSDSAGAALASRKLFGAQSIFSVSFFVKPIFAYRVLLRSRSFESPSCSRASLFSAFVRLL